MYAVRQASNGHQSKTGKMGRNFHTREDIFSELDETYVVKFINSNDEGNTNEDGSDEKCTITIKDDDGVGIHDLEIRSVPQELRLNDEGDGIVQAYTHGDVILVTARFTRPVTTRNPWTGEQTDYAGLYLQIGENRRLARIVRGDGTDELIFAYTVQLDVFDADGISVEDGTESTGFYFNEETGDYGLWPVFLGGEEPGAGDLNYCFHGLDDDPGHPVVRPDTNTTIVDPRDPSPLTPKPAPSEWEENSVNIEPNLLGKIDGELTEEDEGRDWYKFEGEGGEDYFIELRNAMHLSGPTVDEFFSIYYVDNHLVDPSILEILNQEGEQVMGEVDQGGFTGNWARAHFVPPEEGPYYIAVGAGAQARGYLGSYNISIRADDYADDWRTVREVVLRPGESVTGRIDSDAPPDHPGLNSWDWWETTGGYAVPLRGLESLDDRDFIRFEIEEAGSYDIYMDGLPFHAGIWAIYSQDLDLGFEATKYPVPWVTDQYEPGTYWVEIGTPWHSEGNTGLYDVCLLPVPEEAQEETNDTDPRAGRP